MELKCALKTALNPKSCMLRKVDKLEIYYFRVNIYPPLRVTCLNGFPRSLTL